ncbi:MAG: glycosyltransferase [Candidatus Bathyarchaeota archaeon]|nr:glycosyltransferase [Candidatus Bathyarchaeota archaeon]
MHSSLNLRGGAERLSITLINALKKAGNRVTLITTDKTDWTLLQEQHGLTCTVDQEFFVHPTYLLTQSMTSRAVWTLSSYLVKSLLVKVKEKYDVLINTSGEIINFLEDIAYVNAVPMRAAFNYSESLPIKSSWWRCYSRVYDLFLKTIDRLNRNTLFVTNSKFMEAIITRYLGCRAMVVYPPVDVENFKPLYRRKERENLVITVSRFRPGKNLESIPNIAKYVNARFLIIGPSDQSSASTINTVRGLAKKLKVQDRVQLLTNVPRSVLRERLSDAKVLLHTQFYEAFGISVVEAMASGCVPIVPDVGGPWLDILDQEQGKYGFAYESPKEAAETIRLLMEDERMRCEVASRAYRRTGAFTTSIFTRNMLRVVDKVHARKDR